MEGTIVLKKCRNNNLMVKNQLIQHSNLHYELLISNTPWLTIKKTGSPCRKFVKFDQDILILPYNKIWIRKLGY